MVLTITKSHYNKNEIPTIIQIKLIIQPKGGKEKTIRYKANLLNASKFKSRSQIYQEEPRSQIYPVECN